MIKIKKSARNKYPEKTTNCLSLNNNLIIISEKNVFNAYRNTKFKNNKNEFKSGNGLF